MSNLMPPEYDEKLNHVFFAPKRSDDELTRELRCQTFLAEYKAFVNNRQDLINELRNIADESVSVKKTCTISTITGSSFGIAGGTAAVVGTFVFPPLLVGGLAVAGLATASNLGTQIAEFLILRRMLAKVENLSKYDLDLAQRVESAYEELLNCDLLEESEKNGSNKDNLRAATVDVETLGLQLGAGGAKGVTVLGLRSVGLEVVEVGSALVKGVTRGALGIGIVIDGVTVFLSSRDLARGSSTKFSEALNKLADLKEKELDDIMNVIDESNVFASADTVERF